MRLLRRPLSPHLEDRIARLQYARAPSGRWDWVWRAHLRQQHQLMVWVHDGDESAVRAFLHRREQLLQQGGPLGHRLGRWWHARFLPPLDSPCVFIGALSGKGSSMYAHMHLCVTALILAAERRQLGVLGLLLPHCSLGVRDAHAPIEGSLLETAIDEAAMDVLQLGLAELVSRVRRKPDSEEPLHNAQTLVRRALDKALSRQEWACADALFCALFQLKEIALCAGQPFPIPIPLTDEGMCGADPHDFHFHAGALTAQRVPQLCALLEQRQLKQALASPSEPPGRSDAGAHCSGGHPTAQRTPRRL